MIFVAEFVVDFGSWTIEAKSEKEARRIAEKMLSEGELPPIDNVEKMEG